MCDSDHCKRQAFSKLFLASCVNTVIYISRNKTFLFMAKFAPCDETPQTPAG